MRSHRGGTGMGYTEAHPESRMKAEILIFEGDDSTVDSKI